MNLYIIDFDDSFTFNIASELHLLALTPEIFHWSDWKTVVSNTLQCSGPVVIILGPGPGHPDEYSQVSDDLLKLSSAGHVFLLGICLGHQLLARALGLTVRRSAYPVHGQTVNLQLPDWRFFQGFNKCIPVQRYNSLAFFGRDMPSDWDYVSDQNDEVLVMTKERILSYQFHPESIGTSFREIFFRPVKQFLV